MDTMTRLVLFGTMCVYIPRPALAEPPNFVIILADDLGYGDLGCYGSTQNTTPHIDQLARKGLRFTDFHSNGPMCSATRAALLTGCYQHRFGKRFEAALGPHDRGLPNEAVTIAEVLKNVGYRTGMFGKWHLGYSRQTWPHRQGFDAFIGLGSGDGDHLTQVDRYGSRDWWSNDQPLVEVGYTTDLITQHSIDFIEKNKNQPFFLYVAHLAIHFPWQGPQDLPHRKVGHDYSNDKWGILPNPQNVAPHVEAMISALDQSVGKIVTKLADLGLTEKTLVIFASDNGGYLNYADSHFNISSNEPLKGQKMDLEEGGHRVPAIAAWPQRIPAGSTTAATVMSMDFFPTLAGFANAPLPAHQAMDGQDLGRLLINPQLQLSPRLLFWQKGDQWAVRRGVWKLLTGASKPMELYDLSQDIGETTNLAPHHPHLVDELQAAWKAWNDQLSAGFLIP